MEEDVDEVVAPGLEAAEKVVEAEGEHAERPIGAVGAAVVEGGSPEVVLEQASPWSLRQEVGVAQDGAAATKMEIKI